MSRNAVEFFETLSGQRTGPKEARNGLRHAVSLSLTKVADGLIDPKLVLSWLLTALGSPASIIALLVPIREAGALLPQILLGRKLERMRHRKWMWAGASVGQGVFAALIALSALLLDGWQAGVAVCAALGGLALCRAAASVSYKEILGKTVETSRRGAITGTAGSVASAVVVLFALSLIAGVLKSPGAIVALIFVAALLWAGAALIFARIEEDASEPARQSAISLRPLREDAQFRRFIAVRGALSATALAPPFLVLLSGEGNALGQLGALVLASSGASFLSSYVWGRFADTSSRRVLITAALGGAAAMALAVGLSLAGLAGSVWAMPSALFLLMIAYHGVRQGRSIYLVDMSPDDKRPAYAALANTLIGTLLLAVGAFGGVLSLAGPHAALAGLALLCLAGGWLALGLEEVEGG